jgi:hypothetical protein
MEFLPHLHPVLTCHASLSFSARVCPWLWAEMHPASQLPTRPSFHRFHACVPFACARACSQAGLKFVAHHAQLFQPQLAADAEAVFGRLLNCLYARQKRVTLYAADAAAAALGQVRAGLGLAAAGMRAYLSVSTPTTSCPRCRMPAPTPTRTCICMRTAPAPRGGLGAHAPLPRPWRASTRPPCRTQIAVGLASPSGPPNAKALFETFMRLLRGMMNGGGPAGGGTSFSRLEAMRLGMRGCGIFAPAIVAFMGEEKLKVCLACVWMYVGSGGGKRGGWVGGRFAVPARSPLPPPTAGNGGCSASRDSVSCIGCVRWHISAVRFLQGSGGVAVCRCGCAHPGLIAVQEMLLRLIECNDLVMTADAGAEGAIKAFRGEADAGSGGGSAGAGSADDGADDGSSSAAAGTACLCGSSGLRTVLFLILPQPFPSPPSSPSPTPVPRGWPAGPGATQLPVVPGALLAASPAQQSSDHSTPAPAPAPAPMNREPRHARCCRRRGARQRGPAVRNGVPASGVHRGNAAGVCVHGEPAARPPAGRPHPAAPGGPVRVPCVCLPGPGARAVRGQVRARADRRAAIACAVARIARFHPRDPRARLQRLHGRGLSSADACPNPGRARHLAASFGAVAVIVRGGRVWAVHWQVHHLPLHPVPVLRAAGQGPCAVRCAVPLGVPRGGPHAVHPNGLVVPPPHHGYVVAVGCGLGGVTPAPGGSSAPPFPTALRWAPVAWATQWCVRVSVPRTCASGESAFSSCVHCVRANQGCRRPGFCSSTSPCGRSWCRARTASPEPCCRRRWTPTASHQRWRTPLCVTECGLAALFVAGGAHPRRHHTPSQQHESSPVVPFPYLVASVGTDRGTRATKRACWTTAPLTRRCTSRPCPRTPEVRACLSRPRHPCCGVPVTSSPVVRVVVPLPLRGGGGGGGLCKAAFRGAVVRAGRVRACVGRRW